MGLLDRFRRPAAGGAAVPDAGGHLASWCASRRGIEGFVEPPTAVAEVTLLLVAHDGEWTRRRVPSVKWAHDFCNRRQIPSYDAGLVGVPQRMRDYNRRRREGGGSAQAPSDLA